MIEIKWIGPFSWPKFEEQNKLPSIPEIAGLYIKTFEYKKGYIIYSVGITRRTIPSRLREHTREYLKGNYNIFDVDLMHKGIRKSLWQGWVWTQEKKEYFSKNILDLQALVNLQLSRFRIFTGEISLEERLMERLEAKIMSSLYHSGFPYSEIPDRGMMLSPRRDDETSLAVKNNCEKALFGLPIAFEI